VKVIIADVPRPRRGVWMPNVGPGDPLPPLPSGSNGQAARVKPHLRLSGFGPKARLAPSRPGCGSLRRAARISFTSGFEINAGAAEYERKQREEIIQALTACKGRVGAVRMARQSDWVSAELHSYTE